MEYFTRFVREGYCIIEGLNGIVEGKRGYSGLMRGVLYSAGMARGLRVGRCMRVGMMAVRDLPGNHEWRTCILQDAGS